MKKNILCLLAILIILVIAVMVGKMVGGIGIYG